MLAGIPVIAIGYHHKSQGIMDSLNLGRLYTSIRDLDAAWMLEKASAILARPEAYRAEIRAAVNLQREAIERELSAAFPDRTRGTG
jgi:polysaccharide pyruvyl transferase WcaK-like protein